MYQLRTIGLDDLVMLAQASGNDDTPAMNEIVRRFEPLVKRTATRVSSDAGIRDDIENDCRLSIVHATRNHRPGIAGFPNYVRMYVKGEARRALRRLKPQNNPYRIVPLDTTIDVEGAEDTYETLAVSGWEFGGLTAIVERLSWQQRVLLTYRYVEDLTLSDIALRVGGLSESAISQRLSTIRRIVETEMKVA